MIKKIVIAPDSFKGTLSSFQVCEVVAKTMQSHFPNCEILQIPVADGGEGSVDCLLSCLLGEKINITVKNLFMEDIDVYYGYTGDMAIIEMASCVGLPLAGDRKNPLITTTYGVGQMIIDALNRQCKKIIISTGGSATNDGGCGMAAACGVRFYDKKGTPFIPAGGTLSDIDRIDISGLDERIHNTEIFGMCDTDNPMFGEQGAAYIFAPQKGASSEDVILLDKGLQHLSQVMLRDLAADVANMSRSGSAGAMGSGMVAFFNAQLFQGIEMMLDYVDFDARIQGADFIVTGEGCFDYQSLLGKAVIGVAGRAQKADVPVIVIAGGAMPLPESYDRGISAIFTTNRLPHDLLVSCEYSANNLKETADGIARLIKVISR